MLKVARTLPANKKSESYRNYKLRTKTYKHRSMTEPYLCPVCDNVWQHLGATNLYMEYVYKFPKMGCSKKVCKKCKNL